MRISAAAAVLFLQRIVLVRFVVPDHTLIPAPPCFARFPTTVTLVRVKLVEFGGAPYTDMKIPPPSFARFPVSAELVNVTLSAPPPPNAVRPPPVLWAALFLEKIEFVTSRLSELESSA